MKLQENLSAFDWEVYCKTHEIESIALFGSYARGEQTQGSDLDLLVKFNHKVSLLRIIQIQLDLQSRLGLKVDLLTHGALGPHIGPHILSSRKVLYEKTG